VHATPIKKPALSGLFYSFGTEAGLKYRPNPLNPLNIKKPFKVLAPLLAPLKMT